MEEVYWVGELSVAQAEDSFLKIFYTSLEPTHLFLKTKAHNTYTMVVIGVKKIQPQLYTHVPCSK